MLKAKVEWLEVRLGLRVTKRLLDKNRVETLLLFQQEIAAQTTAFLIVPMIHVS